jgi:hypothetical protein
MADQSQQRQFRNVVEEFLAREAGYAAYRSSQRDALRGRGNDPQRSRPLEFDESGFPLPQDRPGFARRVARLLNPS